MKAIHSKEFLLGVSRSFCDCGLHSSVFHFFRGGEAELLARGIVFAIAGQDNDADIVVVGGPLESLTPLVVDLGVKGVVLLGAVEGNNADAMVMDLDVEGVEMGEDGWHCCDGKSGEREEKGRMRSNE